MKIAFVGAGRMGRPMVDRLVRGGHKVSVMARNDETRSALTALGADAVADITTAAAECDIAVVCVFTDDQVQAVAGPLLEAMPSGSVLLIHTTGSPATARTLADRAAQHGIAVVDAPVSGGPHDIAAGQVTVFVGGEDAAVAQIRTALTCYAEPILHVGAVGSGQGMKLVNNTVFAAQIGLVAEAVALGERLGIAETVLLDALRHGSGASRGMDIVARSGSASTFINTVGREFLAKDVEVARATATQLGADLGRLGPIVDAGLGR